MGSEACPGPNTCGPQRAGEGSPRAGCSLTGVAVTWGSCSPPKGSRALNPSARSPLSKPPVVGTTAASPARTSSAGAAGVPWVKGDSQGPPKVMQSGPWLEQGCTHLTPGRCGGIAVRKLCTDPSRCAPPDPGRSGRRLPVCSGRRWQLGTRPRALWAQCWPQCWPQLGGLSSALGCASDLRALCTPVFLSHRVVRGSWTLPRLCPQAPLWLQLEAGVGGAGGGLGDQAGGLQELPVCPSPHSCLQGGDNRRHSPGCEWGHVAGPALGVSPRTLGRLGSSCVTLSKFPDIAELRSAVQAKQ